MKEIMKKGENSNEPEYKKNIAKIATDNQKILYKLAQEKSEELISAACSTVYFLSKTAIKNWLTKMFLEKWKFGNMDPSSLLTFNEKKGFDFIVHMFEIVKKTEQLNNLVDSNNEKKQKNYSVKLFLQKTVNDLPKIYQLIFYERFANYINIKSSLFFLFDKEMKSIFAFLNYYEIINILGFEVIRGKSTRSYIKIMTNWRADSGVNEMKNSINLSLEDTMDVEKLFDSNRNVALQYLLANTLNLNNSYEYKYIKTNALLSNWANIACDWKRALKTINFLKNLINTPYSNTNEHKWLLHQPVLNMIENYVRNSDFWFSDSLPDEFYSFLSVFVQVPDFPLVAHITKQSFETINIVSTEEMKRTINQSDVITVHEVDLHGLQKEINFELRWILASLHNNSWSILDNEDIAKDDEYIKMHYQNIFIYIVVLRDIQKSRNWFWSPMSNETFARIIGSILIIVKNVAIKSQALSLGIDLQIASKLLLMF